MPKLYGANLSPFVRKVRVGLAIKGIEYEQDPIVPFGVSDEYKKISPLGKIPAWQEDDGFSVPDSSVILSYLERTRPEPALYPTDPKELARALWFEEYSDSKLTEVCGTVFFQRFVRKNLFKQEPDEELVKKAIEQDMPPVFDYLESQLSNGSGDGPIVGSRFSIADLSLGSPFINARHGGYTLDAARWPKLAAYLEYVHGQPAYKDILAEELASVG